MFKAIVDAETLQEALNSVSVLTEECKLHLNEDGLAIRRPLVCNSSGFRPSPPIETEWPEFVISFMTTQSDFC